MGKGLTYQIEKHNKEVRKNLLENIKKMDPTKFEYLVGQLLTEMGFESVEVTLRHADGGIDVRGVMVINDVIKNKMAVQVKRWKNNIQSPAVQQTRGSLGAHEQGLIITTSDFSSGARKEAERKDAIPVALMNGEGLVSLMVENLIQIRKTEHDLLELNEAEERE